MASGAVLEAGEFVAGQQVVGGMGDGVGDRTQVAARPAQLDLVGVADQVGVRDGVGGGALELPPLTFSEGQAVRDRAEA